MRGDSRKRQINLQSQRGKDFIEFRCEAAGMLSAVEGIETSTEQRLVLFHRPWKHLDSEGHKRNLVSVEENPRARAALGL